MKKIMCKSCKFYRKVGSGIAWGWCKLCTLLALSPTPCGGYKPKEI